jgi:hypothetical protein
MESEKQFGKLFNLITLESDTQLELILTTMNKSNATYILTQAVKYAYEQGCFSIGESEVISKSIRVLGRPEENNQEN